MGVVLLYRYLKGYVKFSAGGGFTERFINLCAVKKIPVFDGKYIDGTFYGITYVRSFRLLRETARKTGVRISVVSKNGIIFNIIKNKYRMGLAVGALFYCLFLVIMNVFVWNIEAGGSERYSPEQILEVAEGVGVKWGISRFFFDERKAAREIYKAFSDELSWVTVNIIASKCYVDVRDSDVSQNEDDEKVNEPSNLIADFDGVILSDETYSGIRNISKGNAVKKGDLLISGVMDNEYGSAVYYVAEGNFTARHTRNFKTEYDNENYKKLSSGYGVISFNIFGIPLMLSEKNEKEYCFRISESLSFDVYELPFAYTKTFFAGKTEVSVGKENRFLLAVDSYTQITYDELGDTEILAEKITVEQKEDSFSVAGEYDCIDFIGISKPIIVENIESK